MADQKNSVHTVFTGEANLAAAEAELNRFAANYQKVIAGFASATDAVDNKTMQMVRNFNRAMGTMRQAQNTLSGMNPRGSVSGAAGTVAAGERADAMAAKTRADAMARLVGIERELMNLRARDGGTAPRRIQQLRQEREELQRLTAELARSAEVRRRAEASGIGRTLGANDRQTVSDARAYVQAQERVAQAKNRIMQIETQGLRVSSQELQFLKDEVRLSERLLRLHEQDASVMGRVLALQARQRNAQAEKETRQGPQHRMAARADLMADYSALAGVQLAAYSLFNFAVQEESALAKFQAIASASGIETAKLAADMRELGQNTKFSNLEIAETATLLAQTGLSASDTGPALKAIAELATAAGVELKQAADVVTSVSNIWLYNTSQMGDIANVLTAALNQTKLGMDQMQLGIQYAGNAAMDAGVDFVELTSIMGAMAQAGIRSGSTIGTGLRTLLVDLQTPSEKSIATLQRLGLSMADVDVRSLGLTEVLHNLKAAGFTSADAFQAFEIRAASAFTTISNNLDTVDRLQTSLYDGDAASRANAIQMDTLAAKWRVFANVLLSTGSDALAPVISFLKMTLIAGTELMLFLGRFTPVLQVATAAIVTMIASFAISRIGMAIASLRTLTLTTLGLGTAAAGTTVGIRAMAAAFLATPAGWITLLASGAAVVFSLADSFEKAQDRSDALDAAINELTSRMEQTKTTMKAVDDTVDRLNTRYTVLSQNEVMRERLLNQTRARFESLGLQIDKGSNSVDSMIEALGRLRAELAKDFDSQLMSLAGRLQERVDEINKKLRDGDVISDGRRRAAIGAFNRVGGLGEMRAEENIRTAFGPQGESVGRVINGDDRIGRDITMDKYKENVRGLQGRQRWLQMQIDRQAIGSSGRNANQREYDNLTTILSVAREFIDAQVELAQATDAANTARDDQGYQAAISRTAAPGNSTQLEASIMAGIQAYEARRTSIERGPGSAQTKADELERLKASAEAGFLGALNEGRQTLGQTDPTIAPYMDQFIEALQAKGSSRINSLFGSVATYRSQAEAETRAAGRTTSNARDDGQQVSSMLSKAELDTLKARFAAVESELEEIQKNGGAISRIEELRANGQALIAQIAAAEKANDQTTTEASRMYDRRGGLIAPGSNPTSGFGSRRPPVPGASSFHQGLDYAMPVGTPVVASGTGTVVSVGNQRGYGKTIEIEHENGIRTLYAHLSEFAVEQGQRVAQGQRIASSGNTGTSSGAHLHFGVKRDGVAVDPRGMFGRASQATENDPDLNRLSSLQAAEAAAKLAERQREFGQLVTETLDTVRWEPLADLMKSKRQTNATLISSLAANVATSGDETTSLAEITAEIRRLADENVGLASDLLTMDPDNKGRLDNPVFQNQVFEEKSQEVLKSLEALDTAYANYAQLQAKLTQQTMAATNNEVRIANATAGTSGTTKWLLDQRVQMEAYEGALRDVTAAEVIRADALLALAAAQRSVAEAQAEMDAATTDESRNAAGGRLATAQGLLARARDLSRRAEVGVRVAQQGATAATPVGPLATNASTATARGTLNPSQLLTNAVEQYKQQSGVMTGVAQTVADGIYASFTALGDGIQTTINQIADGSITIQGAFSNIFGGILKEMQGMAAKIAANWIMQYILKMVLQRFGVPAVGGGGMDAQGMSMLNSGPMPGLKLGGPTPARRFALGGGQPGRDSVHGLLEPGEITMRKSAVDFIGRDQLLSLNAMGNRRLSAAGGRIPPPERREPDKVELYVVAPDQVPPPSEKQIVHFIGESIARGELKKLVKSVSVGG